MTNLKRKIVNQLDHNYVKRDCETDRFFLDYIYGEFFNHYPITYRVKPHFDCVKNPKRIWCMTIHDLTRDEKTVLRSYREMRMFFYLLVANETHDKIVGNLRFTYPKVERILKEDDLMPEELRK